MLKKNRITQAKQTELDSNSKRQNSPSQFIENAKITNNLRVSRENITILPNKNFTIKGKSQIRGLLSDSKEKKILHESDLVTSNESYVKSINNSSRVSSHTETVEDLKKQTFEMKNKSFGKYENTLKKVLIDEHNNGVNMDEINKHRTEAKTPAFKERGSGGFQVISPEKEILDTEYYQTIVQNIKMQEQNKQSDELIKLFKEALNYKKREGSNISQKEQIQCIDTKIQEILSSRKKYNSLENLHKKVTAQQISCLDETKASSSTSSQTRVGVLSNKFVKAIENQDFQPPRTSDKNNLNENITMCKPRIIRTTTPYKPKGGLESHKFLENKGKNINFNDINSFKRIENPIGFDERFAMNGTIKPYINNKEDSSFLPPLVNNLGNNGEKLTFTGTFNPKSFEKSNQIVKNFGGKVTNLGSRLEMGGIQGMNGFFRLEDAVKAKGIILNKNMNKAENDESGSGTKQKIIGKFPKDVFATNVKRKFFV